MSSERLPESGPALFQAVSDPGPLFAEQPEPSRNPSVPRTARAARRTVADSFRDVRLILRAVDAAMRAEGVAPELRRAVLDRLIWAGDEGAAK